MSKTTEAVLCFLAGCAIPVIVFYILSSLLGIQGA